MPASPQVRDILLVLPDPGHLTLPVRFRKPFRIVNGPLQLHRVVRSVPLNLSEAYRIATSLLDALPPRPFDPIIEVTYSRLGCKHTRAEFVPTTHTSNLRADLTT